MTTEELNRGIADCYDKSSHMLKTKEAYKLWLAARAAQQETAFFVALRDQSESALNLFQTVFARELVGSQLYENL